MNVAEQIIAEIPNYFTVFGAGWVTPGNPISYALKDKPPTFTLGVEVSAVVEFVLARSVQLNGSNGNNNVRRATERGDGSSVFTGVPQKTPHGVLGIPIGVNDLKGQPIHIGDKLCFDTQEWGGECEFVVELSKGKIIHPGATADLTDFCEIIEPWNGSNGGPKPRSYVKLDGDSRESKILAVLDKSLRHRTGPMQARSTAMLDRDLRDCGYTVMSISTRLSRLRATWRAMGVGELRRIDEYKGGKRISAYWLEKASA